MTGLLLERPPAITVEEWAQLTDRQRENRVRKAAWERFHGENAGSELRAPYLVEFKLDHKFVTGDKRGCCLPVPGARGGRCGRGKLNPLHHGYPPSYRVVGSGDQVGYQGIKQPWDQLFMDLMEGCGLPKGLGRVTVEGTWCVPRKDDQDQGNLRFFAEKCIGDALVKGGWLLDDSARHYSFGNYELKYAKDQSWSRFVLFPAWETPGWEEFTLADDAVAPLF